MTNLSSPQSFQIFQKYHEYPSQINYVAQNNFILSQSYHPLFRIYQHRVMKAYQVLDAMTHGIIMWENTVFNVIFTSTTRGNLIRNPDVDVYLSFRAPQKDMEPLVLPVVLVSASSRNNEPTFSDSPTRNKNFQSENICTGLSYEELVELEPHSHSHS